MSFPFVVISKYAMKSCKTHKRLIIIAAKVKFALTSAVVCFSFSSNECKQSEKATQERS